LTNQEIRTKIQYKIRRFWGKSEDFVRDLVKDGERERESIRRDSFEHLTEQISVYENGGYFRGKMKTP